MGTIKSNKKLEIRTSDPTDPELGSMWLILAQALDTTLGATYSIMSTSGGAAPFYACTKITLAEETNMSNFGAKVCKVSDGSGAWPNGVYTPLKLRVYGDNAGNLGTLLRTETIYTPTADDKTSSLTVVESDYVWRDAVLSSTLTLPAGTYWFVLVAGAGTEINIVYRCARYSKTGSGYFVRTYDKSINNWQNTDAGTADLANALRWS